MKARILVSVPPPVPTEIYFPSAEIDAEIANSYTVTLTVTDNSGDSNGWQGSIIVEENIVTGSGENDENDNTLIVGGAVATIGISAAVVGLRYFRSEEEDDFFEFENAGPVNLSAEEGKANENSK